MGKAIDIIRRSIYALCQYYQSLTSVAALLVLPVSAATLFSQSLSLFSWSISQTITSQLQLLFEAAGFPSSPFLSLLNFKLSQTIISFIFSLPFNLTFFVLAKASVFLIINGVAQRSQAIPTLSLLLQLYPSLLLTYICNSLLILSANAAVLSLLFLAFNIVDTFHVSSSNIILILSAAGIIIYSLVLANAVVICNLSIIISAADSSGGYFSILKALTLVRGKMATAISLTLPTNLGIAAIEALLQHRVVQPYRLSGNLSLSVVGEAFSITYMHSLLLVIDTIIACIFFKSCNLQRQLNCTLLDWIINMEVERKEDLED